MNASPVQRRLVSSRYPPNPAISRPMSSLTRSRAAAAAIAGSRRPAWNRSAITAVSTGTNAASWKSNVTAAMIGSESAYAAQMNQAQGAPSWRSVNAHSGGMARANSTAWATSRVAGPSWIQYSGASMARIGDQWSDSSTKCAVPPSATPRAMETGAPKWA